MATLHERYPALHWFTANHLPQELADVVAPYAVLAMDTALANVSSDEVHVTLRKLLEAKDAAVRAAILTRETNG
jgi:formylmethanofuran dehydrogenase subunit B